MQLICPNCGATYEVPENAVGPNGRKVRCRACETSWFEAPRVAAAPPPAIVLTPPVMAAETPVDESAPAEPVLPRRVRVPWLLLALVVLVVALGGVAATFLWGPQQMAQRLGIADHRVPLGIAITRQPDWRKIGGGGELFAVSGRIWNPTAEVQPVPDIRAELKDARGKTVYAWTIVRPVARLAPNAASTFDGAAVDVPASSSNVSVSFAGDGQD